MSRPSRAEVHSKVYGTPRWKALRAWALAQSPVCPCGRLTTLVHHVQPIRDGGDPWDPDNLKPLCVKCHAQEHKGPRQPVAQAWAEAIIDLL